MKFKEVTFHRTERQTIKERDNYSVNEASVEAKVEFDHEPTAEESNSVWDWIKLQVLHGLSPDPSMVRNMGAEKAEPRLPLKEVTKP